MPGAGDLADLNSEWAPAILWLFAVRKTGECIAIGNAFIVGAYGSNALVFTAAHNVTALDRLAVARSPFKTLSEARIAAPHFGGDLDRVLGLRASTTNTVATSFAGFSRSEVSDAALGIAFSEPADPECFRHAFPIKLIPPEIGTPVIACGWSGFKKEYERIDDLAEWRFSAKRSAIAGTVVGSFMSRSGVAPGPCFEIEGDFPPGLSGSPVVCDVDGIPHACGVVSTGMDSRATVAMIWPVLGLDVPAAIDRLDSGAVTLLELAKRGGVKVARSELEHFGVTGRTVEYQP